MRHLGITHSIAISEAKQIRFIRHQNDSYNSCGVLQNFRPTLNLILNQKRKWKTFCLSWVLNIGDFERHAVDNIRESNIVECHLRLPMGNISHAKVSQCS